MILLGPCGSGPAGSACSHGRAVTSWCCGRVLRGWLVVVLGVEDTPAAGGLLRLLWSWWSAGWWVPPRACVRVGVACCRGSGAVRPGCLTRFSASLFVGGGGGCGWVGCELYSGREHLTVRFLRQLFVCSCVLVVCFFERSVDALASGADEGRGGLRYSSGSRLAGCDPRVSEWGDPARVMSCHLHLNCIGCGG